MISHRPRGRRDAGAVTLRNRLGIVALIFLTLVLFAVGVSALMVRSWHENLERTSRAASIAERTDELVLGYTDQESGVVDYQTTLNPLALAQFQRGEALVDRAIARLSDRELDDPAVAAQFDVVRAAGDAWRSTVALPVVTDRPDAPDEDTTREVFETLRDELDTLTELASADLADVSAQTDRVRAITFAVLFTSAMVAILGTALVTMLFHSWVTRPLARIRASLSRLRDDDTAELPETSIPELREITTAIRDLQGSLVATRDRALTAYEGLTQSAVLALQVRAELADEIGELPDGWSAASRLIPAEGVVAGDCFDVGLLDPNNVYVVMIDVTGHGAQTALDALHAKSQMRAALRMRRSPAAAIHWLNDDQGAHRNMLTAIAVVVQLSSGIVRYASAGHPPMLMTDGTEFVELPRTGPIVGAFDATWTTAEAVLPTGWSLVVHTDGVTDVIGDGRERFGEQRLRGCLTDPSPRRLITAVNDAVEDFRNGNPRADDLTIIAIQREPIDGSSSTAAVASERESDPGRE